MSLTRDTYNNFGEIHNSQELDWMFPSRAIIILSQPYLSLFSVDLLSQRNVFFTIIRTFPERGSTVWALSEDKSNSYCKL